MYECVLWLGTVAMEAADVELMLSRLSGMVVAFDISRRCRLLTSEAATDAVIAAACIASVR